jgi:hypothetical protein
MTLDELFHLRDELRLLVAVLPLVVADEEVATLEARLAAIDRQRDALAAAQAALPSEIGPKRPVPVARLLRLYDALLSALPPKTAAHLRDVAPVSPKMTPAQLGALARALAELARALEADRGKVERALASARARLTSLTEAASDAERAGLATWHGRRSDLEAEIRRRRAAYDAALAALVGAVDASVPLVLFPVRLETRFELRPDGTFDLLVRLYPDAIHEDAHEPALTPDEAAWRAEYLAATVPGATPETQREAWRRLATRVGSARASWLADGAPSATRSGKWTRPPHTEVLPDRWMVVARFKDPARPPLRAAGELVPRPLAMGPGPGSDGLRAMGWTMDFEAAVAVGMALRIPGITRADATAGLDLLAYGVRGTETAADSERRLEALLAAHRYSHGLGLLAQGTPTNNNTETRSPWTRSDDADVAWALRTRPPRSIDDARGVEAALGLRANTLNGIAGCDGRDGADARAANTLLWPATFGYYLEEMLQGTIQDQDFPGAAPLDAWRRYFIEHVRARGPLGTLRVGRQPYGLLPVTSTDRWRPLSADLTLLCHGANRAPWTLAAHGVGTGGDVERIDDGLVLPGSAAPALGAVAHAQWPNGAALVYLAVERGVKTDDASLRVDGGPAGWYPAQPVPGLRGDRMAGVAVCVAAQEHPLDNTALVVRFDVDAARQRTYGYLRAATRLERDGRHDPWSAPIELPELPPGQVSGVGMAIARPAGRPPELLVAVVIDDQRECVAHVIVGVGLRGDGTVEHWSKPRPLLKLERADVHGAGLAVVSRWGGRRADLVLMTAERQAAGGTVVSVRFAVGRGLGAGGEVEAWHRGPPVPLQLAEAVSSMALAPADLVPATGFNAGARGIADLGRRLRAIWRMPFATPQPPAYVPHVGATGDPDLDVLDLLAMDGVTRKLAGRSALSRDAVAAIAALVPGFVPPPPPPDPLKLFGVQAAHPRLAGIVFSGHQHELPGPNVTDGPLSETEGLKGPANYLGWLLGSDDGRVEAAPTRWPFTLYRVVRQSILRASQRNSRVRPKDLVDALTALADDGDRVSRPTAVLDRLLGEIVDLGSHRLDAWLSSMATHRLRAQREDVPTGVQLAGYGWVEDLKASDATLQGTTRESSGFVHAPSLAHAATAAVLRSGWLTHRDPAQRDRFAVDVSSARARTALELIEGVRADRPLGSLFGYRLERTLVERSVAAGVGVAALIPRLRAAFPILADKLTRPAPDEQPSGAIATAQVCDGLALLRAWQEGSRRQEQGLPAWTAETIDPGSLGVVETSPEFAALLGALASLDEARDALADTLLAESVYQAVQGNPQRTGGTLDALSRGDFAPQDPEVLRTPRTGIGVTHRILVVFARAAADAAGDWPSSPRAQAGPALDAWAAQLLGRPADARCTIEFVDADGARLPRTQPVDLALDALGLAPIDLVWTAASPDGLATPEFQRRVRLAAEAETLRASAAIGDAPSPPLGTRVRISFGRSPAWGPEVRSLVELLQVCAALKELLLSSRPARAGDLVAGGAAGPQPLAASTESPAAVVLGDRAASLDAAIASGSAPALRAALIALAAFDLPDALPDPRSGEGPAAEAADSRALLARAKATRTACAALLAGGPAAGTPERAAWETRRLFGQRFPVLEWFAPSDGLAEGVERRRKAGDAGPRPTARFLLQASRVRAGAARLQRLLTCAEAAGGPGPSIAVAQFPAPTAGTDDRWAALPAPAGETVPGGRTSIVLHTAAGWPPSEALAAIVVDEWVDVIPSRSEVTGLTFHYDAPGAVAPQAILLAVPPDPAQGWDEATLEDVLKETMELARLRAVDSTALARTGLGQLLPALLFPYSRDPSRVSTEL